MNETLNTLLTRRSIRKFKPEMVDESILDEIMKAGTFAPTGMGKQSPIIICIKDPELLDEIRKENAKIMNRVGVDPFYGAPVIIMVIALNVPTAVYDGSCVIDNIMNAAWSLGVGSCWIHRAKEEMESPFGKKLLEKLNLEGDYIGIGHVALGYIAGDVPNPKSRKENWIYKL